MLKFIANAINKLMKMISKYVLIKFIKPDIIREKITDIKLEDLIRIKREYGIGGIILDVDGTLRNDMQKISKSTLEWVKMLKRETRVALVSNGYDEYVEKWSKTVKIPYVSIAMKPLRRSFLKTADMMGLSPENMLVIGDEVIMDFIGAKRSNMRTLIVSYAEDSKYFNKSPN